MNIPGNFHWHCSSHSWDTTVTKSVWTNMMNGQPENIIPCRHCRVMKAQLYHKAQEKYQIHRQLQLVISSYDQLPLFCPMFVGRNEPSPKIPQHWIFYTESVKSIHCSANTGNTLDTHRCLSIPVQWDDGDIAYSFVPVHWKYRFIGSNTIVLW